MGSEPEMPEMGEVLKAYLRDIDTEAAFIGLEADQRVAERGSRIRRIIKDALATPAPSSLPDVPRIPTPKMIAAAWGLIERSTGGVVKLGPGLGIREIWQAMFDAALATDGSEDER